MENKSDFNRELSAEIILQNFVIAYTHGKSITEVYSKFSSDLDADKKPENIESNAKRRKINERCRDLFKDLSKKRIVERKIESFREEVFNSTGVQATDSQITKMILQTFSDMLWGDDKRKYNMSHLASKGMIRSKVEFEPFIKKDENQDVPHIRLKNKNGDFIYIEYMGRLKYETLSSNEYLCKHRIYMNINNSKSVHEVFSNIDINQLAEDSELRYVVFTELLSKNNIENSYCDQYIGETSRTTHSEKQLKPGEELEQPGFYRYQITSNYALEYNGERIEAIRAYKQQEANKNDSRE